jgi:hypothetical protein
MNQYILSHWQNRQEKVSDKIQSILIKENSERIEEKLILIKCICEYPELT